MGCLPSKSTQTRTKKRSTPRFVTTEWRSEAPLTLEQLIAQREEFWDTQPHYGGNKVVWDTLKAVVEADNDMKPVLIESAGLYIGADDLSIFYDERGWKYELPKFVISDPVNLQT